MRNWIYAVWGTHNLSENACMGKNFILQKGKAKMQLLEVKRRFTLKKKLSIFLGMLWILHHLRSFADKLE